MGIALTLFVSSLVISSIYATRLVLSEDTYEPSQKYCQIAIIWLIPIIGSVIVCGIILSDRAESKPKHHTTNVTNITDDDVNDLSRSHLFESIDGE
jgi:hypothetical protein